jgi:Bacterial Ig domain
MQNTRQLVLGTKVRKNAIFILMTLLGLLISACGSPAPVVPNVLGADIEIVFGSPESENQLEGQAVSNRLPVRVRGSSIKAVAFYLDDASFAGEPVSTDTQAPFKMMIDTARLNNGEHVLSVKVQVGNKKLPFAATFTVNNGEASSEVSVQLTVSSPTVQKAGTLSLSATRLRVGDAGVKEVLFFRNGVLFHTDIEAPFETSVALTNSDNGTITFSTVAKDYGGTEYRSNESIVTVNIPTANPAPEPTPAPTPPAPTPPAPTPPAPTPTPTPTGTWIKIADEKTSFTVSGTKTVRFGADTRWVEKSVTDKGECNRYFFGGDPADGVVIAM